MGISDHGPYSEEIDLHGGAEGPFEPHGKLKPGFIGALEEAVSEGDLFVVVPW